MKTFTCYTTALVLLLGAAGYVAADRISAQNAAQSAAKAWADGDVERAEKMWLEAIEQDESYLPGRLGLAEHYLRVGPIEKGVEELRTFVESTKTYASEAETFKAEVTRGVSRLQVLEDGIAALERERDAYIRSLMELSAGWMEKDPDLAQYQLSRVLRLDPEHEEALERLDVLPEEEESAVQELFNGEDAMGWVGVGLEWRVDDGVFIGKTSAHNGIYTSERFKGDFDVLAEVKLLRPMGTAEMFGLSLFESTSNTTTLAYGEGRISWEEYTTRSRSFVFNKHASELDSPVDARAWNVFEFRVRGDRVEAYINGTKLAEAPRRIKSAVAIGLRVQHGEIRFRRVELRKR